MSKYYLIFFINITADKFFLLIIKNIMNKKNLFPFCKIRYNKYFNLNDEYVLWDLRSV